MTTGGPGGVGSTPGPGQNPKEVLTMRTVAPVTHAVTRPAPRHTSRGVRFYAECSCGEYCPPATTAGMVSAWALSHQLGTMPV